MVVDGFHPSVLSRVVPTKDSVNHPSWGRHHGGVFRAASTDSTSTALFMGKLRNKQADLQKKMMLAKKQKEEQEQSNNGGDQSTTASSSSSQQSQVRLSDMEMKEQNDRKRFEELLASSAVSMSDVSSDYLTEEQELENIDAYRKCLVPDYASGWKSLYCMTFKMRNSKSPDAQSCPQPVVFVNLGTTTSIRRMRILPACRKGGGPSV